jgi:hypothetical protein
VIIFWILTLFVGSSAFALAYIYLHYVPDRPVGLVAVTGST